MDEGNVRSWIEKLDKRWYEMHFHFLRWLCRWGHCGETWQSRVYPHVVHCQCKNHRHSLWTKENKQELILWCWVYLFFSLQMTTGTRAWKSASSSTKRAKGERQSADMTRLTHIFPSVLLSTHVSQRGSPSPTAKHLADASVNTSHFKAFTQLWHTIEEHKNMACPTKITLTRQAR